eukprot:CAMPEP_0113711418 /NCGR_PEP_ID=MMETSP0038_2-20120614/30743_1 /TAXON_ID=2898 /ORGANISM="Cryptomonas paramecium" /LENGTH=76 /DNA_ID=CAMNT_0000637667 /DNA_START=57 /DNA_END=287 /DNA_ORIENTATION=+ /assembly_acc=CAM_ASM_000170
MKYSSNAENFPAPLPGQPRLSENRVRDMGQPKRFHVQPDVRVVSERRVSSWLRNVPCPEDLALSRRPSSPGSSTSE